MKEKRLLSSFMVMLLFVFSLGFSVPEIQLKASTATKTSADYTIADAVLLQNFLLNVLTETDLDVEIISSLANK